MMKPDKTNLEQRLLIVGSDGSSRLLKGDTDNRPMSKGSEDMLPSYLSLGWRVINTTSFNTTGEILILIQRELRH